MKITNCSLTKIISKDIPIVILSAPRTGSTLLIDALIESSASLILPLHRFSEPSMNGGFDRFSLMSGNKNYVLKVHAKDLIDYPEKIKKIIEIHSCYLIRIRRKNLIDQLTSWYISKKRNTWKYTPQTKFIDEESIDFDEINNSVGIISQYNFEIDNYPADFDLDIYYEDLNITTSRSIPTPSHKNYNLIRQTFKDIVNSQS